MYLLYSSLDASVSYLGEDAALENIKQIRNLHEIHEVDSLFTRSPCFLPISNGNIKPFSEEGFTVSTWIQIDGHSDSSRHPKHCEEVYYSIRFNNIYLISISIFSDSYTLIWNATAHYKFIRERTFQFNC